MGKKLRKADYIAKYGEEAWNAKEEKRREYNKRYREDNKEHIKQYREANKEYYREYSKQWREANKGYFAERGKQWHQDNKERAAEYRKQYRKANKEHIAEYGKQRYKTQWGRANNIKNTYISMDKKKGFPTDQTIDEDWIIKNIFTSKCIYCGDDDWTHLGADRIDNNKPHTPDNCACACGLCNMERQDKYSVEEFKEYRRTHPRKLGGDIEKSWEIVEQNGVRVIKKKEVI